MAGVRSAFLIPVLVTMMQSASVSYRLQDRLNAAPNTTKPPTYLMKKFGYPSEVHTVQTEDGYLLRLDRIPNPGRPAVLLGHALLTSAAAFLVNGGKQSLGFTLYNAGYDVWLANFRGNGFSLEHVNLTIKDPDFWKYSVHEHGVLDLPAFIDSVVQRTGQPSVLYVGYSMGTVAYFVMESARPEYNDKLRAAFLLAPVAFLSHTTFPLLQFFYATANQTMAQLASRGIERYPLLGPELLALARVFCPGGVDGFNLCHLATQAISRTYKTLSQDVVDTIPTSMSVRTAVHFGQLSDPKWPGFRRFNFGKTENRRLYGQDLPLDYDLSRVSSPTHLYVGTNDAATNRQSVHCTYSIVGGAGAGGMDCQSASLRTDVKSLIRSLRSLKKVVWWRRFDHLDFILNNKVSQLYDTILVDMRAYS